MTHPTLTELRDELRRGGVVEAEIHDAREHVHGLCNFDGRVIINPKPGVVDTLIHELLHRRYPRWGEARVARETIRLLSHMTDEDVAAFYRLYRRRARKSHPITVVQLPTEAA